MGVSARVDLHDPHNWLAGAVRALIKRVSVLEETLSHQLVHVTDTCCKVAPALVEAKSAVAFDSLPALSSEMRMPTVLNLDALLDLEPLTAAVRSPQVAFDFSWDVEAASFTPSLWDPSVKAQSKVDCEDDDGNYDVNVIDISMMPQAVTGVDVLLKVQDDVKPSGSTGTCNSFKEGGVAPELALGSVGSSKPGGGTVEVLCEGVCEVRGDYTGTEYGSSGGSSICTSGPFAR
jgi:hypothetical protein